MDFPKLEIKILKFWKRNKIFEKSIKNRAKAPNFVFYEGPPTANGRPGLHHVLARIFKDIICRYKTMQGFRVERKAGWDTHGLPVELEVEKMLGLKSKKDIEKYGIEKFNKKCKESVWLYKKEWEGLTERIGFWLDMEHPYITYENNYIESVWWIIKQIWDKKLLYQDYKVIPYCPRCGTGLSSHEVALGYKSVKENSVYIKFKILSKNPEWQNTSILSWTTTPWTLPGNVALAINPKIDYICVPDPYQENQWVVLALENFKDLLKKDIFPLEYRKKFNLPKSRWKNFDIFKGSEIVGIQYEPLFDVPELQSANSYKVYPADFVTTKEGSGIVHTAVMYGEEDYELGKEVGLPTFHTVTPEGNFIKTLGGGLANLYVKSQTAETLLLNLLRKKGNLLTSELYQHDYPFCWRCDSPLLYYAKKSWFIKMQAVKDKLIENNQKINWVPGHLKKGRFGEWLKEIKDWAISRERYWGTPLPIWECEKCQEQVCIGSKKELTEKSVEKIKIKDRHRPFIDKIIFQCKCGAKMYRVPEVIDCWFDSGAMPFAQGHWPFSKNPKSEIRNPKLKPPKLFPADYISEGIDQTRGWFYTLLAISTLLGFGPAFKNVISLGHVLDEKGEKMSKSKGNVVDPWEIVGKYGTDATRWYFYTINQPGDSKLFSEKDVEKVLKKFIMTFWHSFLFYKTYVKEIKKFGTSKSPGDFNCQKFNPLDKWIISELQELILKTTKNLDNYDVTSAARAIENFTIDSLSNWYIRRSRRRFQKPANEKDFSNASRVLGYVLFELAILSAPFVPFLSEGIYQNLTQKTESIHLEDWPEPNKRLINKKLKDKMNLVRETITLALAERAKAGIKVRQPLKKLKVKSLKLKVNDELLNLIKEEVNVKEIVFDRKIKKEVGLDTKITPELKEEGIIREVIRNIQEMRKSINLKPRDKILVKYSGTPDLNKILSRKRQVILKEAQAKDLILERDPKKVFDLAREVSVNQQKLRLAIKKI